MKRLFALLLLTSLLSPLSAMAATSCSVSTTGLNFGSLAFLTAAGVNTQTQINITCTGGSVPATVGMGDAGGSLQATGTGVMKSVSGAGLYFHLYQDPTRNIPWGSNSYAMTTTVPAQLTIYGSIPCSDNGCMSQPVQAGAYSDSVTVSVTY